MMNPKNLVLGMAITAAMAIVMAPGAQGEECSTKAGEKASSAMNIVETAASTGQFETLLAAAKAAGLAEVLAGDGPYTLFAPTDEAFAKLPEGTVDGLLKDVPRLQAVLKYHVVAGAVGSEQVVGMTSATSLLGQELAIDTEGGVTVGGANVIKADVAASNGVIHVIDSVLLPQDITAIAAGNPSFTILVAALQAAELDSVLAGDGPFTVFAPTDAAFSKLPAGTVENLLKPENREQLQSVLKYHVVAGKSLTAADVVGLKKAETANGESLTIKVSKSDKGVTTVTVDEATIGQTDINALNGVIHVIDTVVLPRS